MPNIMTALKTESVRLARKEAKAATDPLRKSSIATRKAVADLKRMFEALRSALTSHNATARKAEKYARAQETTAQIRARMGCVVRSGHGNADYAATAERTIRAVHLADLSANDTKRAARNAVRGLRTAMAYRTVRKVVVRTADTLRAAKVALIASNDSASRTETAERICIAAHRAYEAALVAEQDLIAFDDIATPVAAAGKVYVAVNLANHTVNATKAALIAAADLAATVTVTPPA
jgi:hypothetical protein